MNTSIDSKDREHQPQESRFLEISDEAIEAVDAQAVYDITTEDAVNALYKFNLYSSDAAALSSYANNENIAVVEVLPIVASKLEAGEVTLDELAQRIQKDNLKSYELTITYDKDTNAYAYYSSDKEITEVLQKELDDVPPGEEVVTFLEENSEIFTTTVTDSLAGWPEPETVSDTSSAFPFSIMPLIVAGFFIVLGLGYGIITFVSDFIFERKLHKSKSYKGADVEISVPDFSFTRKYENENDKKGARETMIKLQEKATVKRREHMEAQANEEVFDPSLNSLENRIAQFEKLVISHRYISQSLSEEISKYANLMSVLENKLKLRSTTEADKTRLEFEVINSTLIRSLGNSYYIDICKNPELWNFTAKRLSEVSIALSRATQIAQDSIVELNANRGINLRDSLERIINKDDENLLQTMLRAN